MSLKKELKKNSYQKCIFPLVKLINEETGHNAILKVFRTVQGNPFLKTQIKRYCDVSDGRLEVQVFGLFFKNPLGLAAGFDKNALAIDLLANLGFGHVETGTITPLPQKGNPKPRLFRLDEDFGIINRFGFSNVGIHTFSKNLSKFKKRDYVLGINIGPNKKSIAEKTAIQDYSTCIGKLQKFGDYFTINISSPNTEGLRLLQAKDELDNLLNAVFKTVRFSKINPLILVKISPDLTPKELLDLLEVITSHPVAGIIATNTTVIRPKNLKSKHRNETGGLSGLPLRIRSNEMIRTIYKHTSGKLPIIGVGGVFNGSDAIEKIKSGATLIQLFTGFVYQGPSIARQINLDLLQYMQKNKIKSVRELVGLDIKR